MNNDLLGSDGVAGASDDILGPARPRSLEPDGGGRYFGLPASLGGSSSQVRSHSAAPETWEYGRIHPSPARSAGASAAASSASAVDRRGENNNGGFFVGTRLFDDEEDGAGGDRGVAASSAAAAVGARRPASTGVIGRPNGAGGDGRNDGDVNSILQTLGLGPPPEPSSSSRPVVVPDDGGRNGGASLLMGPRTPSGKKSIMEKINEREPNDGSRYFASEAGESGNVFSNRGGRAGLQGVAGAPSSMVANQQTMAGAQQYVLEQQQQPSLANHGGVAVASMGQQFHANQYVQQTQTTPTRRQVYQQDPSHYEPQPQQQHHHHVYYQHQQAAVQAASPQNYQDYGAPQQQANLSILHGAGIPAGPSGAVYHIPAGIPAPAPYGFEYLPPGAHHHHLPHVAAAAAPPGALHHHVLLPHAAAVSPAHVAGGVAGGGGSPST